MSAFDVIIVGGRPAGASLAARLGALEHRVLIVDRATFPSLPTVPSSPILHAGAMSLLDEIGIEESTYSDDSARSGAIAMTLVGAFSTRFPLPVSGGRAYVRGVDRQSFDLALWNNLARYPSVTRREGFIVEDVVREAGVVVGVIGRDGDHDGHSETIRGRWVVGADGRYSTLAKRVGARVQEDFTKHLSSVYYADWADTRPSADAPPHTLHIVTDSKGTSALLIPGPRQLLSVNIQQRADLADFSGSAQAHYAHVLQSFAPVVERLTGARQVTPLVGIKRIGNRMLEPAGRGWMLVGDAFHHKDPLDGQGIYDALLESKVLSEELHRGLSGEQSETATELTYASRVRADTQPMFHETVRRLQREVFGAPSWLTKMTIVRWLLTDPKYQMRFTRFLNREVAAKGWLKPSFMAGVVWRGLRRDVRARFGT